MKVLDGGLGGFGMLLYWFNEFILGFKWFKFQLLTVAQSQKVERQLQHQWVMERLCGGRSYKFSEDHRARRCFPGCVSLSSVAAGNIN